MKYNSLAVKSRILAMLDEKNVKAYKVLPEIGLSKNTLDGANKSMPKADTLAVIADYLNCSVDYLLGRTDNPSVTAKTYINGENGIQTVVGGAIEHNTVTISPTDEMTKEISLLLSNLTYRQKTDLMKQIYDFVDDTKKKES